jgi:thiopeptide-type bacteriocin biosynthesis protein
VRPHANTNVFRAADTALIRAAAHPWPDLPPWPDLTDPAATRVDTWVDWLRRVWAIDDVAEALDHASPTLAQQVRSLCVAKEPAIRKTRRAVLSVGRYLQRLAGRATPFGLLAGVAAVSFGTNPRQCWGKHHQAIAHAGAEWLAAVIKRLEKCPELLGRLPVVANTTLIVRGSRVVVPHQPHRYERESRAVEVSLRHTPAVRAALEAAQSAIQLEDLSAKIQAEFPAANPMKITAMLTELVERGALITRLHAPSTEPDALGHLLAQLQMVDAVSVAPVADLVLALREIHSRLEQHNRAPASEGRAVRTDVAARMRRVTRTRRHPLALDLRLDGTVVLPREVACEVERAAELLCRLSAYPTGTPAWRAYHQRFYERFGIGSMVPLLEVVGDSGIGLPDGYPGTVTPEQRSPMSSRDETLLGLAQCAAIEGRDEFVLDEQTISALELRPEHRPPSHLELAVRVRAVDQAALWRGDFTVEVVTVSRAAGVLTGRFLSVLAPHDRARLTAALAELPGGDSDTVAAQLSFPPLDPATAHVTRALQTLPTVISLAEHRTPGEYLLTPEDLAVGCDGRRMYLAAPARGQRLETTGMHALNLRIHTPPLARFLTELSRAQSAQVTVFDWGAAACLPFLPRLRYGRTILSPARWRLNADELPARPEPWTVWDEALTAWLARRRAPRLVHLTEGDRLLLLDLDQSGHRAVLRAHLSTAPYAVLTEAPSRDDDGWCDGRPHEVVIPLTATQPPRWPRLPNPAPARIVDPRHARSPATADVLLVSLYGDLHRQDAILVEYLSDLLARFEREPAWWYVRYRDPAHHLRLRIALPESTAFGEVATTVSTWADELRRIGLLGDVVYPTSYAETGRWGPGPAWAAAEEVFIADSRAMLVQLGLPVRPRRQALVAAHAVAIAKAFTGSTTTAMQWLIDNIPASAPARVPRPVYSEAVRIADPHDNWSALRTAPGGAVIADAWKPRDQALAHYRTHLHGPHTQGIAVDDVLSSLLHVNFVRAYGIDFDEEAVGLHLARAAALSWTARYDGAEDE